MINEGVPFDLQQEARNYVKYYYDEKFMSSKPINEYDCLSE